MIMKPMFSRRDLLRSMVLGCSGVGMSTWFPSWARALKTTMAEQDRHCILLWMSGGPSQTDTWDLKP
ncbi:MAG: DUF1501 domain-containing protein, partial [Planctomycetota bacterium]